MKLNHRATYITPYTSDPPSVSFVINVLWKVIKLIKGLVNQSKTFSTEIVLANGHNEAAVLSNC